METTLERLPGAVKSAKYYENGEYCCSEYYHRVSPFNATVATDGALHVFDHLQCFWIADIIASVIPELKKQPDTFLSVRVHVTDGEAEVYITDGDYVIVYHQHVEYTDLTHNVYLFLSLEEPNNIILLPSEY